MATTISELLVAVGADISGFASAMVSVASTLDATGDKMVDLGGSVGDLNKNLESVGDAATDLAGALGIALSGYEALKSSFEEFSSIQKAQIAMGALTGSAQGASDAIDSLRQMALSEGLDFPALVTATQRMTAFGLSATQIPQLLQAAADAAAATNTNFDTVSGALDRMVLSGTAAARQLATLGLSLSDLGDVMGVSADQAAVMFKSLDESSRINVLTDALSKYAGVAQEAGEGLAGTWDKTKTDVSAALENVGEALAPLAESFLNFTTFMLNGIPTVVSWVDKLASSINTLGGSNTSSLSSTMTMISAAAGVALGSVVTPAPSTSSAPYNTQIQQALTPTGGGAGGTATSQVPFPEAITVAPTDQAATQQELNAAFTATKTAYDSLVDSFKGGVATTDQVNAAYATMTDAAAAAGKPVKDLGVDSAALSVALQDLGVKPVQDQIAGLEASMVEVQDAYSMGVISTQTYDEATKKFISSMNSLTGAFQATTGPIDIFSQDAASKLTDALGPAMLDQTDKMVSSIAAIGTSAANTSDGIGTMDGALKAIGQTTLTDSTDKVGYLQAAVDSLNSAAGVGVPLAAQKAGDALIALDKAQIQVSADKLDEQSLGIPDLNTLQDTLSNATTSYTNLTNNGVLNAYQTMEAQKQTLIDQISYYQQLGVNTSDLKTDLDQLNLSLQSQPTLWSASVTAMKSIGDELKTGVGTAIDGVIAGTASMSDAFKTVALQIVDIIVNTMIKLGVTELLNSLAGVDGIIGTIAKDFGGVATAAASAASSAEKSLSQITVPPSLTQTGGVGDMGSIPTVGPGDTTDIGSSGTGAIGDTVPSGDTLAGVGGDAASAGSSATDAGSSVLGISSSLLSGIGAIAQVGTLIAGVVGDFQQATTNDTLWKIMGNTLGILNVVFQLQQDTLQPMYANLQGLTDWMQGPIHEDLVTIWGELQDGVEPILTNLLTALSGITSIATTAVGPVSTPTPTDATAGSTGDTLNRVPTTIRAVVEPAAPTSDSSTAATAAVGTIDFTSLLDPLSQIDSELGSLSKLVATLDSDVVHAINALPNSLLALHVFAALTGDVAGPPVQLQSPVAGFDPLASAEAQLKADQSKLSTLTMEMQTALQQNGPDASEQIEMFAQQISAEKLSIQQLFDNWPAAAPGASTPTQPGGGSGPIQVNVYIDGQQVTNAVVTYLQNSGTAL